MRTSHKVDGITVAVGEIEDLPGCSQIAVFHSAFVLPQYRNLRVGEEAHLARLDLAKKLLYDAALCTVSATNEAQIRILRKNGWILIMTFKSRKTGNDVCLYARELGG